MIFFEYRPDSIGGYGTCFGYREGYGEGSGMVSHWIYEYGFEPSCKVPSCEDEDFPPEVVVFLETNLLIRVGSV